MSSDRLKHWKPTGTARDHGTPSAVSTRDGSIAVPSIPVVDAVQTLDLNKADLHFPPVRQPTMPLRRYTRRLPAGSRRPTFLYSVSPRVYSALWLAVLVLHSVCAVYLGFMGATQFYLLGTSLIGYLTLYGIAVDAFFLPPIGVGYFVVCGLHAFSVVTILFYSLRSQRSVFTSAPGMARTVTTPVMRLRRMSLTALSSVEFRTQSVLERLPSPFVRACFRTWHFLTKLYTATYIHNECYYAVYVSRLIAQVLVHIYQLYLSSLFLPQPRLNTVWVALFVANCWAPPLLSALFRANRPRTRLLCVAVNLALDMAALVVLPVIVSYPYVGTYNAEQSNYPRSLWYKDVWFIRTVNEFRMLMVVTPLDFVTKIAIGYNVWRSLRVVPIMLRKVNPDDGAVVVVPAGAPPPEPDPVDSGSVHTMGPLSHADSQRSQASSQNLVVVEPSGRCSAGVLGSIVLMLLGAGVLGAHVHANSWTQQADCGLPVQAWFVSKPACSFLEYRCHRGETGREEELVAFFANFDPKLVSYVSIRYCPSVEIPPEIHAFENLLGIKLYNSTIVRWDNSAAMSATHHPNLRFVFLVDVQMTTFPRGLMSMDFPSRLRDIEIHRTNLTTLPDDLDQYWPRALTLALEEFPFTEFPAVVPRLHASALSLAKSRIVAAPRELFESDELYYVLLNENPLSELPSDVTLGDKFTLLAADATLLARVPEAFAGVEVAARDTPLCRAREAAGLTNATSAVRVDCAASLVPVNYTMYPIELEEQLNGRRPE